MAAGHPAEDSGRGPGAGEDVADPVHPDGAAGCLAPTDKEPPRLGVDIACPRVHSNEPGSMIGRGVMQFCFAAGQASIVIPQTREGRSNTSGSGLRRRTLRLLPSEDGYQQVFQHLEYTFNAEAGEEG
jgi:hypothetical protein